MRQLQGLHRLVKLVGAVALGKVRREKMTTVTKTINPHKFTSERKLTDREESIKDEMIRDLVAFMNEIRWREVSFLGSSARVFWGHFNAYKVMVALYPCPGCEADPKPHSVARHATLRDTLRGFIVDLNQHCARGLAGHAVEKLGQTVDKIVPLHWATEVETVDVDKAAEALAAFGESQTSAESSYKNPFAEVTQLIEDGAKNWAALAEWCEKTNRAADARKPVVIVPIETYTMDVEFNNPTEIRAMLIALKVPNGSALEEELFPAHKGRLRLVIDEKLSIVSAQFLPVKL